MTEDELKELYNGLCDLTSFFIYRDRMNGMVHLQEVRWSPITEKSAKLRDFVERKLYGTNL